MEVITTNGVVSVILFTVSVSESEMQAYESCLSYLLDHLPEVELMAVTGHSRDEPEAVRDDLLSAILTYCDKQLLPDRYNRYKKVKDER